MQGIIDDNHRVKKHPDAEKEYDRESILQRQRLKSRTVSVFTFAHHHAGKKCAQSKRDIENLSTGVGHTDSNGNHT